MGDDVLVTQARVGGVRLPKPVLHWPVHTSPGRALAQLVGKRPLTGATGGLPTQTAKASSNTRMHQVINVMYQQQLGGIWMMKRSTDISLLQAWHEVDAVLQDVTRYRLLTLED